MTTETKILPVDIVRDGALKATIWRNEHEKNGAFYSVNLARIYKDNEGKYHDTDSMSGTQLLRLARLAEKAYDRISALRAADMEANTTEAAA